MENFATTTYPYYGTGSGSSIMMEPDYSDMISTSGFAEGAMIWILIACILAIVGGILLYCLFARTKNDPKGKVAKWFKDFLNFKIMWIEPILKTVYYIGTIFIILFSFTFLSLGGYGVLMFFLTLIFGPLAIRLTYEFAMMFIMIWRNTKDIAESTVKKK